MPKVIYEKILGDPLLYTNRCLQLANQWLYYPKGVLEDAIIWVGQSNVPVDFVVLEIGGDERAPIILGRPFLSTAKPSFTQTMRRSISQSRIERRSFLSRNESCNILVIHKRHTFPKRQQWPRRRITREGGRTRLGNHQKNQLTWSTHSDLSMTISSLHHSLLRRMILVYQWLSVPLDKESSTRPSAILDRVST
jgi:hypothetical protein